MLQKLKMLFQLRAWLKSNTLKTGGIVAAIGAAQTFLSSQDGIDLLTMIAGYVGLSGPTLVGIVLGLIGLAGLVQRALTERSLASKVAGPAPLSPPPTTGP